MDPAWFDKMMIYGPLGLFATLVIWGAREVWFAIWQSMFRSPTKDEHGNIDPGGYVIRFFAKAVEGIDANMKQNEALTESVVRVEGKIDKVLSGAACRNYEPNEGGNHSKGK